MANGTAYGFVSLEHLFGQRVSQVGVEVIRTAIKQSTDAYNEELNALLAAWCERSTVIKERVELPGDGTLQSLDEWGNPLPVRPAGQYDVGYPIQGGGTAWGTNRVSSAMLSVEEANRYTMDALRRDAVWMRQRMLAAVFTNSSWVYTDKLLGNVSVSPLANGDAVTYLKLGAVAPTTDNHYLAQAAAISDAANPFPVLYDELLEHPSNADPFVAYVASNLTDSIEGLTSFVEINDPDVIVSTQRDRLATDGSARIRGPGDTIMGKANRMWIVEWRALPDNYIVAVSQGAGRFLRMREYDAPSLQGMFSEFHSPDGNLIENRFLRYAGFGIRDRVAAAVMRIGNASYATPTGFAAPLP